MKIEFTLNAGELNVSLDGRLDTTTAPEFEAFLNKNLMSADELSINCEKLAYVSSAGLRVLLSVHKKMKGEVKLTNVNELVMEVFDMTGFTDILTIE